jgi:hypothetical protein
MATAGWPRAVDLFDTGRCVRVLQVLEQRVADGDGWLAPRAVDLEFHTVCACACVWNNGSQMATAVILRAVDLVTGRCVCVCVGTTVADGDGWLAPPSILVLTPAVCVRVCAYGKQRSQMATACHSLCCQLELNNWQVCGVCVCAYGKQRSQKATGLASSCRS